MAIVAAGIVTGYDWSTSLRFKVRLDLYSHTTENSASGVLTPSFDVEDAQGFVNAGIYTFVRDYITASADDGGWGMVLAAGDTIEIINPYIEASAVAALNSKFSAFLPLSEDTASHLRDTVGGFDLTNNNGVAFEPGAVGTAARFVAFNSRSLTHAYDAALNPTDGLTFSCRVQSTEGVADQGIAGTWAGIPVGWMLIMTGGAFRVYVAADALDAGSNYGTTQTTLFADGLWHSVVVHIDGAGATDADRLTITVDDVPQTLDFTGTIPAAIMDDGGAFTIGNWNGNFFEGPIDECELRDVSGALIAQWPFEGGIRYDSIGSNHFYEVGTVAREATNDGSFAAVFDGGPNYLYADDSADLVSGDFDWGVPLWVKPDALAPDGTIFSSWWIDPTGAASRSVYELWWLAGGGLLLKVHDGTTLNEEPLSLSIVPVDRWSLIVVQYDASTDTISVKVNQQEAESFVLTAPILNDSNRFYLGSNGLGEAFVGAIRRFGYAPHLLTDAEVLTLWNNGAGQDWPMEEAQPEGNVRFCRLGVDHEISDTAKTMLPGMSFVLEEEAIYSFEFTLLTTANADTVGVQIAVETTGDAETGEERCNYQGPASASTLQWLSGDAAPFIFDPTVSQGNVPGTVKISGTTETHSRGTLRLLHGSSTATLTTVLSGSWGMCARHSG